eukprot:scaffold1384_cov256-Pinguiococcus_pyrenoidosus.AAC.1
MDNVQERSRVRQEMEIPSAGLLGAGIEIDAPHYRDPRPWLEDVIKNLQHAQKRPGPRLAVDVDAARRHVSVHRVCQNWKRVIEDTDVSSEVSHLQQRSVLERGGVGREQHPELGPRGPELRTRRRPLVRV